MKKPLSMPSRVGRYLSIGLCLGGFVLGGFVVGCQPQPNNNTLSKTDTLPTEPSKDPNRDANGGMVNALLPKITFRQPDGTPEFSLQFKSSGGKLLDGAGQVITHLVVETDGAIRLSDTNHETVGYVVRDGETVHIESPKRTKVLFSFLQNVNGDATLTRSNGSTVYQLSATDDGYTVASDKRDRYTVSTRKASGQLQTEAGETVIATDRAISPAALASFGFTKLTQAQQAGLAYALSMDVLELSVN